MEKWQKLALNLSKTVNGLTYISMTIQINNELDLNLTIEEVKSFVQKERGLIDRSNRYKTEKKIETRKGQEEIKPIYVTHENYYTIYGKDFSFDITKDNLRRFKDLYCTKGAHGKCPSINQCAMEMDMPRNYIYLVKTAFGITHDDVPFIDEDIEIGNTDELAKLSLQKKKELYFLSLQNLEVSDMKKELEKYRKKDFFYNKVIESLNIPIEPIKFTPIEIKDNYTEAQLNLADWHTGLKTLNHWGQYSVTIQKERLNHVIQKTKLYIKRHKVKTLHIFLLGDMINGMIHTSTRVASEIDTIEQLKLTFLLIRDTIIELASQVEIIKIYSTYGNHSRLSEDKKDAVDNENLEVLIPFVLRLALQNIINVEIVDNEIDDQIIVANIFNHLIYASHGDRDKPETAASNLTMMLENKPYKVFIAHGHHFEQVETHKVDVIESRALCGTDPYAKNIRKTSKAGQSLYIYNKEELECTYDICFK